MGRVRVHLSAPGAALTLDGAAVAPEETGGDLFVSPGAHALVATAGGYVDARATVDATAGSSQDVVLTLVPLQVEPPTPTTGGGPSKAVLIAGGAAAGAALAMGAVFAGLAKVKANDAATMRSTVVSTGGASACAQMTAQCRALQSAMNEQATFGNVAVWSFIGAGVVGGGTVIYALVAPKAAKSARVRAVPWVASGGGGLVLQGDL